MLRYVQASSFVAALALLGCGGHDAASPSPTATAESKAVVTQTMTDYYSLCNYQTFVGPIWSGLALEVAGTDAAAYPPDVDDPLGGTPESGPLPTTYENGGLGLWENLPSGDYSREDFYVDQALTQPAGFSTDVTGSEGIATTEVTHYEITAGLYAGSHGDSKATFQDGPKGDGSDDLWHETYSRTASDGTVYTGTFDYKGLAFTSSATTTRLDGTKDTIAVAMDANDKGTITFVSHTGVTLTAKATDYGTDTGTFTGDAPGLPARFSQDTHTNKVFTVRFHDGSSATFGGDVAAQVRAKARKAAVSRQRAHLRTLRGR